jgi:hypothetical protein
MFYSVRCHPRGGDVYFVVDVAYIVAMNVCDSANAHYVAKAICAYMSLLDDSPLVKKGKQKPFRVYLQFFRELTTKPIKDTVLLLASYADRILTESYVTGSLPENGDFIEELEKLPIFPEYHAYWRTSDASCCQYILTFLRFLKKMKYVDSSFQDVAFRNWLDIEHRLSGLDLSYIEDEPLLKRLVHILIGRPKTSQRLGHFGSGAVSEYGVRGSHSKALNLKFDWRLRRILLDSTITEAVDSTADLYSPYKYLDMATKTGLRGTTEPQVSSLRFVPKDLTKSRSICMEPNAYMFAQQNVLGWFEDSFRRNLIRRFVVLEDQTLNQRGAQYGSETLSLDTIDLSSASDTVHIELVRRIFPKIWFYYLLGTRTKYTCLPDGRVIELKKFAPMGSAVCFPVQCVIFTALTLCSSLSWLAAQGVIAPVSDLANLSDYQLEMLINRRIGKSWDRERSYDPKRIEMPAIYGDDILSDARITDDLMRRLRDLGFDVNSKKSFRSSQAFRESCGRYYYQGSDVTPISYTVAYAQVFSPVHYASLIGACNNALHQGYMNLRSSLIRCIRTNILFADNGRNRWAREEDVSILPFTTYANLFGIQCSCVDESDSRYNADLQINERRVLGIRTVMRKPSKESFFPHEAYQYAFVSQARSMRDSSSSLDSTNSSAHSHLRPEDTRFYMGWTPCR